MENHRQGVGGSSNHWEIPRALNVAAVFGRFNPLTVEHEKLLDMLSQFQGEKYVFVFGKNETPLSIDWRIAMIEATYPDYNVINGPKISKEGIYGAIKWIHANHPFCNLFLVGGSGKTENNEGSSFDELSRCMSNLKPNTSFNNFVIFGNPRGNVSGTWFRRMAKTAHVRPEYLAQFLHSKLSEDQKLTIIQELRMAQ